MPDKYSPMAEEKLTKRAELSLAVKSSILEAIQATIEREKELSASRLGGIADVVQSLADIDLYGKNTPGDGYAKNTTQLERGDLVSQPAISAADVQRLARETAK